MALLDVLTLAQLQTYQHLLQELEGRGVSRLTDARQVIAKETEKRHQARRRPVVEQAVYPCPHCGTIMRFLDNNEQLTIYECRSCRYSTIIEGDI